MTDLLVSLVGVPGGVLLLFLLVDLIHWMLDRTARPGLPVARVVDSRVYVDGGRRCP